MEYKIACITPVSHIENAWENLSKIGKVDYFPDANYELALNLCLENNIVFVNPNKMKYKLDENLIKKSNLKYIVTASTGTNHIDLIAASNKNIKVIALTKEHNIIESISSTAEHALALTLALIRNIPKSFDEVKRGKWDYYPFIGRQINHLTVGVIGYGRLGRMYSKYMNAMGAKVIYNDPFVAGGVSLDELLEKSHVISLHVHLNDSTRKMVNSSFISRTKIPYIINTSRGEIVDETAIISALHNKQLKGYATDVICNELGEIYTSELINAAKNDMNIIITPHIGGMTKEAQEIAYNAAIELLKKEIQ